MSDCARCGGSARLEEETGSIEAGRFEEVYVCANCGATGIISGRAEALPQEWSRTGSLFNSQLGGDD